MKGEVWTACEEMGNGTIAFVSGSGRAIYLAKRLEPSWASDASAYLNYSKSEVLTAPSDLLGRELLSRPGGFSLRDVAVAVPPIRTGVTRFVGSRGSRVDISIGSNLEDANSLGIPVLRAAVSMHGGLLGNTSGAGVFEGLIGSSLPVLVFRVPDMAPDNPGGFWEVQYVPDATATGQQPLAARFLRLDSSGSLRAWPTNSATSTTFPNGAATPGERYFDSYQYIPELYGDKKQDQATIDRFWVLMLENKLYWDATWAGSDNGEGAMKLQLPGETGRQVSTRDKVGISRLFATLH